MSPFFLIYSYYVDILQLEGPEPTTHEETRGTQMRQTLVDRLKGAIE